MPCWTLGERTSPRTGISFSRTSGWAASSVRSVGSGASRTFVACDPSAVRFVDAGALLEHAGRLPESLRIDAVAAEREVGDAIGLLGGQQPRAHALELGDDLVVDGVVDDTGLLGRADHAAVEGLADEDVDDGHADVGGAVQVNRSVAGADADARLARLVRQLDDARAAGGPDQVDAGVVEERVGVLVLGLRQHLQSSPAAVRQPRRPCSGSPRRARRNGSRAATAGR